MKTATKLHDEVENAGHRYDEAVKTVLAVIEQPDAQVTPDLLDATATLKQTLHLYATALRRMAAHA